ncbi:MAG: response regulator [Nitrospirota bacterium]|nr:response regulator [Nitrospirota bacterium]
MAKVLVVDSSPFMRGTLKFMLESGGHDVVANTDNAKEALDFYSRYRPEIVTIDISEDEGLGLVRALSGLNPSLKIVTVCGEGNEDKREEARKSGVFGHIMKPYKNDEIQSEISRVIKAAKKP